MSRQILVTGEKTFRITIPDEAKLTFGPWSPPSNKESSYDRSGRALSGTLRVYENSKASASVLAVFSGVSSYRDLSVAYEEKILVEEGSTIWKNDKNGYSREEKVSSQSEWDDDPQGLLKAGD
jgi:hypothetical protein